MKNGAVFLDRDGTIIERVEYLYYLKDLKILPKAADAIKLLNKFKIPTIVITNQPVIARGLISEKGLLKIHEKLQKILYRFGAKIDEIYYCPHHPNGDVKKYRVLCDCRKPDIGMFKKAAAKFNIKSENSFMIGDTFRDIEAGKKFGCKTVGVGCGSSDFRKSIADFWAKDLFEGVNLILREYKLL